jgi:hypothetical protein
MVGRNRLQASSHNDLRRARNLWSPQKNVGASLLAKAVGQLISMLNGGPQSLAGKLPQ